VATAVPRKEVAAIFDKLFYSRSIYWFEVWQQWSW